jgi:hypothetical protein
VSADLALTLLRGVLPDLPLTQGSVLPGRVLARDGALGTLLLAGVRVTATLPDGVAGGDTLRLRVQEATAGRLVLKVVEAPPAAQAAPALTQDLAALTPLALPGGAVARLYVEPDDGAPAARGTDAAARMVFLRYDSPALGRIDVAVSLTGAAVGAAVQLSAGEPVRAARGAAVTLQGALAAAADRPAHVQVLARDETVDLRA